MNSRTNRARPGHVLAFAAAVLCVAPLGGCNILAPLFFLVSGPETYETEYKLDDKRPTVVFIDDPRSQIPRRALRIEILNAVQDAVLKRDLVEDLIDGQAAIRVADADSSAGQMSVAEVGRAIDAEIVIWITVDRFVRPVATGDVRPSVSLRIRVIDALANSYEYPEMPEGRVITVTDTIRRGSVANAAGARSAAEIDIAKQAGLAAAQLFYEHPVTAHVADRGL